MQGVPGTVSPGVKRQGSEAYHSPPSSTGIKNGGAIFPLPHTSSRRGGLLIKLRDNFFFLFGL
jgi:hypothetical protein